MKKLLISVLSIFALVLLLGSVSALTLSDLDLNQFNDFSNPETFKITNDGSSPVTISLTPQTIEDEGENDVIINFKNFSITVLNGSSVFVEAYLDFKHEDFFFGSYEKNYPINDTNLTINFENNPCEVENLGGNLDLKIRDISVESGFGDDYEWFPLDEIEIEIDIENNGPEDIDDIVVEWGLYNLETGEWVIDDEENDFNLKDGDEKTLFIRFKLDDVDEFENNGNYEFFVWATGEDDEFDGNDTCVSTTASKDKEDIKMADESDFVVLDNIEYPETAQCGANVQITAEVWNIGEDEQDDVFVLIENSELGISEQVFIGDIDEFDDSGTPLSFNFQIPLDAEEKLYTISLTVYDEDNDVYENDFDDKSRFIVHIRVAGNCAVSEPVSVSANLESGGKAGGELVILVTTTNIGENTADYRINIIEYLDWASSVNANPETFTLDAGESKESILIFDVLSDVSGEKSFDIEVYSGNKLVATQPVSVTVEASGISHLTGGLISEDNWYLWGIGLFNVILILVIIFVAVRIARKRE